MSILKRILFVLIALIQIALIVAPFIVNDLATKKAGVYRHVYTRRIQYELGVFFHNNLMNHSLLVIALSIIFIILLIYAMRKRRSIFAKIQIVLGLIISLFTYFVVNGNYFVEKMAYPYFIIGFELVLLIQTMLVIILQFYYR